MSRRKSPTKATTESIKIKADDKKIPNKDHFETQLKTKTNIFVDRKKRLKNGYRKHKIKADQED